MNAVISVIGKDKPGILSRVTNAVADVNANVLEISQSVVFGYFTMIMIVEIDNMHCELEGLRELLGKTCPDMETFVMHEDIFNSMHRI
ncbi:MAG: ACT domain-containing protein [Clostridia bacterium]|nr:ACT domain-containing protein [Clostridia bacterium]